MNFDFASRKTISWLETSPEQHLQELGSFLRNWFSPSDSILQQTSGSTGSPKLLHVQKDRLTYSASLTIDFFGLKAGMTGLLCMSPAFIGGRMMVIRALVSGMNLVVEKPTDNPFALLENHIDFAAMVPFQLSKVLKESPEKLQLIKLLILGGAPIPNELELAAQQLNTQVWHTYGMSETLSHIALRKINGVGRMPAFKPFPEIRLSQDERGCLIVDAPRLLDEPLITNDVVNIFPDGTFEIVGRADNVIISAGVKIHPEVVENLLSSIIEAPFVVCRLPDTEAGQIAVLVVEGNLTLLQLYQLWEKLEAMLDRKLIPRQLFTLDLIPRTRSGKIDRKATEKMLQAK